MKVSQLTTRLFHKKRYKLSSPLIMCIFDQLFSVHVIYLFLTGCVISDFECHDECSRMTSEAYLSLFIVSLADMPGVYITEVPLHDSPGHAHDVLPDWVEKIP